MSGTVNLKASLDVLQQKARERTVKTQNIEYDLETLQKKINNNLIKLDPDYQRRHRWTAETSSRLIESLILNIPIPVIFISQDVDVDDEIEESASRYTVIDGQQRLTAIHDFLAGMYALQGLEVLRELNDSFYKDLPPFLKRRLEERTIKCLRIDSTADAQVKFDIFERLNTGSVKLESQELRNATARGPFNNAIKELAKSSDFRALIQVDERDPSESTKVKKMEDVELVLRYFSLRNGRYRGLKKGFRDFLTDSLNEFNNLGEWEIEDISREFLEYMKFIREELGGAAFAKWRVDGQQRKRMSTFNAAVYDAITVGLSQVFSVNEIRQDRHVVAERVQGYEVLFEDKDFFASVSGSVNDAAKVKTRIDAMIKYVRR